MNPIIKLAPAGLALLALAAATPAMAQRGQWDRPGWGSSGWGSPGLGSSGWGGSRLGRDRDIRRSSDSREGKVEVSTFAASGDAAQALGKGVIRVETAKDSLPDETMKSAYEAAVIDQLVTAGYNTTPRADAQGQLVELRISRDILVPAEGKRNPVSGEMEVGVSNRGSMMGMGINIDLSKPRTALLTTRLEAKITDKVSGEVLWEGRADVATRDGDDDWTNQAIATKLAQALFREFPDGAGGRYALR